MIQKLMVNKTYKPKSDRSYIYSWALNVPYLQNEVEFSDGLNIVFGPNGCGKSTLVGLCAFLTASEQGGTTKYTKKWMHSLVDHMGLCHGYPKMGDLIATLEFDGLPVYYHNPRETIGLYKGISFDDDFFNEGLANLKASDGSVGEVSNRKLQQFYERLKASELPSEILGDDWMAKHESFKHDYDLSMKLLAGNIERGNRTFLMDEPEMGFSLLWQADFWRDLVRLTEVHKRQLIVATHCPFALNIEGANYIDMEPGYLDKCRDAFKQSF